jgi:hypothetical protein
VKQTPKYEHKQHIIANTTIVNNLMDCAFVIPYYKIHTLTHIHKSANGCTSAGNIAEKYLQESRTASLVAVTIPLAD